MEAQFTWKTKLFSNRFIIFMNETETGEIRKENWSRKVNGKLYDTEILFETKGFFKKVTRIIRQNNESVCGTITYHKWQSMATVTCEEREYNWQFDNFFRTRWSLGNENGILVKFHSRGFKGTITSYTKDSILVLSAFFVRNFLNQRSAEIAAAT